jgi:peptide/nickel transport system permease protein
MAQAQMHAAHTTSLTIPAGPVPRADRSLWKDAWRQLVANRLALGGLIVILIFLFAAIFGPLIAPYDFLEQNIKDALQPPSAAHWLGTDANGRDIFSRILYGARSAALVAITTTAISLLIGLFIGMAAGLFGGRTESWLMWMTDITMSIPVILLAMLINTALKYRATDYFDLMYTKTRNPFFLNTWWLDFLLVFVAIALISWPGYARLIRGQVKTTGKALYVEAARSIGASDRRIMTHHLAPNSLGPVIVAVTHGMGGAVLLESSLSFLGIGIQPPNASWGSMLSDSLSLWRSFPHLMIVPAVTIAIIQIAFIFLGDGMNDALNPRQRRR